VQSSMVCLEEAATQLSAWIGAQAMQAWEKKHNVGPSSVAAAWLREGQMRKPAADVDKEPEAPGEPDASEISQERVEASVPDAKCKVAKNKIPDSFVSKEAATDSMVDSAKFAGSWGHWMRGETTETEPEEEAVAHCPQEDASISQAAGEDDDLVYKRKTLIDYTLLTLWQLPSKSFPLWALQEPTRTGSCLMALTEKASSLGISLELLRTWLREAPSLITVSGECGSELVSIAGVTPMPPSRKKVDTTQVRGAAGTRARRRGSKGTAEIERVRQRLEELLRRPHWRPSLLLQRPNQLLQADALSTTCDPVEACSYTIGQSLLPDDLSPDASHRLDIADLDFIQQRRLAWSGDIDWTDAWLHLPMMTETPWSGWGDHLCAPYRTGY